VLVVPTLVIKAKTEPFTTEDTEKINRKVDGKLCAGNSESA